MATPNVLREHIYYQGGVPVFIKQRLKEGSQKFVPHWRVEDGDAELWQNIAPVDFKKLPYVAPGGDPFKVEGSRARSLFWCEGEKDVDTLAKLGLDAFTFGSAGHIPTGAALYLTGRKVVIPVDNDDAGRRDAEAKARCCQGHATSIKVISFPELSEKGDVSDWLLSHSCDELRALIGSVPEWKPAASSGGGTTGDTWPEPKPLPVGLLPVAPFDFAYLPRSIAPWVEDIAERMQCPPDYVAVSAMTALGALIGRRVGIKPQVKTDWVEVPNIWGGFIGRPGMFKSPAMSEALKPLHHIEGEAAKAYEAARRAHAADLEAFKMKKSVKAQMAKDALRAAMERKVVDLGTVKTAKAATLEADAFDVGEPPQEPVPVRYRTCNSTYEALTELLIGNPTGILIERDELVSLLKYLDREEHAVARGFYLSGWSGLQPYTLDRIGRGQRHVEGVCVSILGNTQPAKIGEYVRRANADGAGGDGLIQRFGLLVWPDHPGEWRNVDRYPDSDARTAAWGVFDRLGKLDLNQALAIGARKDQYDKLPFLRFDEAASAEFLDWRGDLEQRLRAGEMSPALEGHVAKYRKLVPALALINHLADSGDGLVGIEALLKALAFSRYLESHARRVYGASGAAELASARAILARIRNGALCDGFSARDVQRHGWSGLTDCEHVQLGLDLLADLDHLAAQAAAGTDRGGRPKITYAINPRGRS